MIVGLDNCNIGAAKQLNTVNSKRAIKFTLTVPVLNIAPFYSSVIEYSAKLCASNKSDPYCTHVLWSSFSCLVVLTHKNCPWTLRWSLKKFGQNIFGRKFIQRSNLPKITFCYGWLELFFENTKNVDSQVPSFTNNKPYWQKQEIKRQQNDWAHGMRQKLDVRAQNCKDKWGSKGNVHTSQMCLIRKENPHWLNFCGV